MLPAPVETSTPLEDCGFLRVIPANPVTRRHVRLRSQKEIIEGQEALAIVHSGLGQGNRANPAMAVEHSLDYRVACSREKGQQDAVKALRVGIDGHNGLASHVLRCVRHQPILAEGDDEVLRQERERRHQLPVDRLDFQTDLDRPPDDLDRPLIRFIFALVFGKVSARMLDIELGLRPRIEAFDQLPEPGLPGHQNDLFKPGPYLGRPYRFRS